jgi:DNA-binding NarL/FixJ family response regulator
MNEKKLKLLVADDHRLFIDGIKLILKDELHIVVADYALDGKEAIDKCVKQQFDIVLMDINMPLIDGIDATREIKRLDDNIKVLMVSMLGDYTTVSKAFKAGADGFLLKNADTSEFIKAFKEMQKCNIYLSESLNEIFTKDKAGKVITRKDYIHFIENLVTPREQSVLKLIVEGHTNQVIADTLFLSVKTVDTHRKNMLAKLNLPNTAALVKFAIDNKLV